MGGIGAWGNNNALNCVYMGLGVTPWVAGAGNGIRVTSSGVNVEGVLYGNGGGLTALNWSTLVGVPNTLSGYGVTLASQAEAEAGADTNKPMSALRVFQAIVAKVVQATESALGIARIATQTAVNAGTDDVSIVTPKKLRLGISYSIGFTGYVAFPFWLAGGLIIQWGTVSNVPQASSGLGPTRNVTLPMAFPNNAFQAWVSMNFSTMTTTSSFAPGGSVLSKSVIQVQNNYISSAGELVYIAFGN